MRFQQHLVPNIEAEYFISRSLPERQSTTRFDTCGRPQKYLRKKTHFPTLTITFHVLRCHETRSPPSHETTHGPAQQSYSMKGEHLYRTSAIFTAPATTTYGCCFVVLWFWLYDIRRAFRRKIVYSILIRSTLTHYCVCMTFSAMSAETNRSWYAWMG